jgi:superfamily II DNA or RNA helicase
MTELRPYQQEAIAKVRASMRAGHKRVVLVLATGAGKTKCASDIVRQAIDRGSRVLWMAHRTELVDQAATTLHKLGLSVGVLASSSVWPVDLEAPVQVASIQTLVARDVVRPPAQLIIWDEAHHCAEAAEQWSSLLQAYPEAHVLGLTATPERGDGTGLAPMFTDLVVGASVRQLTEMGHLVPCEVVRPSTWLKAKRMEGNPLAQEPLAAYLEHASGRQGFLFARTVEEAKRYAVEFTSSGIRAECIHAGTPAEVRAAALDGFREGTIRMLSNVYVMTEGTDLPMASACILARGAGTAGMFLQMVGRVLRPAPRKKDALLVDLQGVSHVWGMPEDERLFKLDGKAILKAGAVCRVCGQLIAGYPCACGYAPELGDGGGGGSDITGDKLEKFARMIAQSPEQRRQTFERWIAAARLKGHKLRSVGYKWKAVYGTEVGLEPWFRGWPT